MSGGFNFENVQRNLELAAKGVNAPKVLKTGTTIVGVVFDGGVVLGADTRATAGPVVADKRCKKIHYMAPNIMCCGAGTAADTEMVTQMVSSNLTLLRLESGKQSRVVTAMTMLKQHLFYYQGHVGAALVLGGYDVDGPLLTTISPNGTSFKLPFATMGSGSLAAMSALETGYRDGLTEDDAKKLVAAAIKHGIFNDPYSGTQVDLCVITKDKTEDIVGYDKCTTEFRSSRPYNIPPGSSPVLSEVVTITEEPMETD
jgi:20S proteasome subunit beta 2